MHSQYLFVHRNGLHECFRPKKMFQCVPTAGNPRMDACDIQDPAEFPQAVQTVGLLFFICGASCFHILLVLCKFEV